MLLSKTFHFDGDFYSLVRSALGAGHAALLDSSAQTGGMGKYSYATIFTPFATLSAKKRVCSLNINGKANRLERNPFDLLKENLSTLNLPADMSPYPFFGGAITAFGYELRHLLERLRPDGLRKDNFPDLYATFHDAVLVHDSEAKCVALTVCDPMKLGKMSLQKRFDECCRIVDSLFAVYRNEEDDVDRVVSIGELLSNFTSDSYARSVETILRYIRNGDIYQANLSQAFEFELNGNPLHLFEKLRKASPSSFGAFVRMGGRVLISSSPERFVKIKDKTVSTCPIKGTRHRGKTADEDKMLADELLNSAKDRAELSMIVDLERNDLGRVSEPGSVVVSKNPLLHSHANVHHLSAEVEGRLKKDITAVDVVKAMFPGGSITGAPKIRAMDIISSLEPTSRSMYTGSLGWIGFNGDMDSNLLIRSITIEGNRGRFQVGGGVVADSSPIAEYEETIHKARGILCALGKNDGEIYG